MFTKFHKDWIKIVDFLLMANFWKSAVFFAPDFTYYTHVCDNFISMHTQNFKCHPGWSKCLNKGPIYFFNAALAQSAAAFQQAVLLYFFSLSRCSLIFQLVSSFPHFSACLVVPSFCFLLFPQNVKENISRCYHVLFLPLKSDVKLLAAFKD